MNRIIDVLPILSDECIVEMYEAYVFVADDFGFRDPLPAHLKNELLRRSRLGPVMGRVNCCTVGVGCHACS